MSDYGDPPQDPHPQPNPYGQPYGHQPGSGQPAYGEPAYGQPGYGQPAAWGAPGRGYASWIRRVGAWAVDQLLGALAGLPLWIGYGMVVAAAETTTAADGTVRTTVDDVPALAVPLLLLGILTALGFFVWNSCLRQGRTGYSIGKGVLGIRLVGEQGGEPIGAGLAFVRWLAHIVDALPCYLGYLWPLWDGRRQTFADKLLRTVVINQPKG
jgi:uncharacterized RDD family membrane protein YckC